VTILSNLSPPRSLFILLIIALLFISSRCVAESESEPVITLYLSADQSSAKASSISIEQGIRTALSENNDRLGSRQVSLKILDHRGNTVRARKHLEAYLADPTAIALFSGLHSPPLLATREFINKKGILVLDPWAAASPITRYPSKKNWIFRLSIDDSKAGQVIVKHAINEHAVKHPALLLEKTGWGKSNQQTMLKAIDQTESSLAVLKWFNWGLTDESARILLRQIIDTGADAVLLVANAPEGKVIARAMVSMPAKKRLPIFSHWGITGGDFAEEIDVSMRKQLQLEFIQSSFSFLNPLNNFQKKVFEKARTLYPNIINDPVDIKAPTGFIHAYDLTRLLIAAANKIPPKNDIVSNRLALRNALENLNDPIEGLIKTYIKPFGVFSTTSPDAHEALGIDDFTMAHYGDNNQILVDN